MPIEIAHFEPVLNKRYRVVVFYERKWRPIFWLDVHKDGSIYLGPRYRQFNVLKKGVGAVKNGEVRINYNGGENITDPSIIKKAGRTSFHASGAINSLAGREYRNNLRNIKQQELLCFLSFQHPSKFAGITKPTLKDICLRYPFDEKSPLQGQVYVAPKKSVQAVIDKEVGRQVSLMLPYEGFDENMQNITVQIVLSHRAEGPWPPYTYLLFPT